MKAVAMKDYKNIIKGVRKEDVNAQMAFYELFYLLTFQSAYAIVGNKEEAEEIMQDMILKVFAKKEYLHEDSDVMKRFLRRMAANAAIDVIRKRKDFVFPIEEKHDVNLEEEEKDVDSELLSAMEIREGINELPPTYRSILVLRLIEEMSFQEIAERLDANPSTIRVQYTRGITKLKLILRESVGQLK